MEVKATAKYVRISPKKARPMADVLRGLPAATALAQLTFHPSKAARLFRKLIHSAVASAKNNYNLKENNLKIKTITVDTGPSFKRAWFRSHGSSDRLIKRSSNFGVVLAEITPTAVKKVVATSPVKPEATTETSTDSTTKDNGLGAQASRGMKRIFSRRTTNK